MGRLPTTMVLKRLSMGVETGENTALPLLSTVGSFSLRSSLEFAGDSVVPDVCLLVLAAARALPATSREDGQNDSTPATTPDGQAEMGTAAPLPRSGVRALPPHDGPSDLRVQ